MEENKPTNPAPGTPLSIEQANDVAGGDGSCTSTATVGTSGASVSTSATTPGQAMVAIYDGAVEVTSHVIETVANAVK